MASVFILKLLLLADIGAEAMVATSYNGTPATEAVQPNFLSGALMGSGMFA